MIGGKTFAGKWVPWWVWSVVHRISWLYRL